MRRLSLLLMIGLSSPALAVERLPIEAVNNDALIDECQKQLNQTNGVTIVWFMPEMVFFRMLSEGAELPPEQAAEVRSVLEGTCVVGIVRAHISPFGSFTFFDEDTVLDGTTITVEKSGSEPVTLQLLEEVPNDLTLIINAMKPAIAAAIGRMGENFHFYVFKNTAPDGTKVYDPYEDESCRVSFGKMGALPAYEATVDTICDALFEPRTCKNGKPAHVTWKYDPWTGDKLPD